MLIQAEDKRLSSHEETLEQRRFIQGYKCHIGGKEADKGGKMESKRCVDKTRKWREQRNGPGVFNKPNQVIMSRGLILQALGGAAEAAVRKHVYHQ